MYDSIPRPGRITAREAARLSGLPAYEVVNRIRAERRAKLTEVLGKHLRLAVAAHLAMISPSDLLREIEAGRLPAEKTDDRSSCLIAIADFKKYLSELDRRIAQAEAIRIARYRKSILAHVREKYGPKDADALAARFAADEAGR